MSKDKLFFKHMSFFYRCFNYYLRILDKNLFVFKSNLGYNVCILDFMKIKGYQTKISNFNVFKIHIPQSSKNNDKKKQRLFTYYQQNL